jgi:hypothetical protein
VPACLRTVLASFGLDVSESELRTLCDTTIFGTAALKKAAWALMRNVAVLVAR